MAVVGFQTLPPAKIFNSQKPLIRHRHQRTPTPPIFISTKLAAINPFHLQDLYSSCNHSCHRFPNISADGRVEPIDVNKLRIALSHSSVVVSVFARPEFVNSSPENLNTGGDWYRRMIPLTPFSGQLVGFGRAVSDHGLTASIHDIMVIPSLQRRGMILQRIVNSNRPIGKYMNFLKWKLPLGCRLLTSKGIYDIGALCSDQETNFFKACGFGDDMLGSTTMMFGVPDGCDLVSAGALPVAYGTSHVALIHRANLKSGQVLLVLGAAGGVGLAAVQIGKVCGATVIAVARGKKAEFLKSMGVDHVVDKEVLLKAFLKTRKLKGVDVLYDPVGGKLTKESMKLLNWGAQILVIGFASGEVPVIPANIALVKNWTIHGLYWGSYKFNNPSVLEDSLKELLSWLAKGLITIYISNSYKLQEANLAFSDIKDRKVIGKVMITFDDPKTLISSKL